MIKRKYLVKFLIDFLRSKNEDKEEDEILFAYYFLNVAEFFLKYNESNVRGETSFNFAW